MKKINSKLVKELKLVGLFFIFIYLLLQTHYYKESFFNVIKLVLAHFYLFIIPGYAITLFYLDKIEFKFRFFIGLVTGYAIQSYVSYFITLLLKINMMKFYFIIPVIIIILGLVFSKKVIFQDEFGVSQKNQSKHKK